MSAARNPMTCAYCLKEHVNERHFVFDYSLIKATEENEEDYWAPTVYPCVFEYEYMFGFDAITDEVIENVAGLKNTNSMAIGTNSKLDNKSNNKTNKKKKVRKKTGNIPD